MIETIRQTRYDRCPIAVTFFYLRNIYSRILRGDFPLTNIVLALYNFAWQLAIPILKHFPRIGFGWQQRTLKDWAEGPFDLWIQAASGGESLLTNMVLGGLETLLPKDERLRILVTSGTKQGVDILKNGRAAYSHHHGLLDITVAYFPFDAPFLMEKAFARFSPKLAIIVETELWPGFLITAWKKDIPVLLVNGRMSIKSFQSYKYFAFFFRKYGPKKVLAISPSDRERFSTVIGPEKVSLMSNLKFDRIDPQRNLPVHSPISDILPQKSPFIVLGSIRREEEDQIQKTVAKLLAARPDIVIGLFPKHIERADHWLRMLQKNKIIAGKRSSILVRQPPGTVIVWDVFGELAGAYALAGAAFVGGSLKNLGGQNFLEPLVFGLKPVIGPYWKNFAWVGREIIDCGLVQEVADENELVTALLCAIDAEAETDKVRQQAEEYFAPRKGGTRQVCQQIIETLGCSGKK
jgi:3-deoxy-D-manno-octulosonic-acid transferase